MKKPDLIGRDDVVDKICSKINKLNNGEHTCIALNGVWGCGKSYVMDMIYERLQNNQSYLAIRYDAWENSYYADPLIAIFSSIIDDAKEKLLIMPGTTEALKKTGKKITNELIDELSQKSGKLGILATIIKKLIEYAREYKKGLDIDTNDEKVAEYKSYKAFLNEVKSSLNSYTEFNDSKNESSKIIILVDELDRCLPEMQLVILERLHHLFEINNCAVIIALNQTAICEMFNSRYGGRGEEYLKKFFDITYVLEPKANIFLKNLLHNLKELFKKYGDKDKFASQGIDNALVILEVSPINIYSILDNRELEKFDACIKEICEEFGWENISRSHIFFIIIAAFIRRYISFSFLDSDIVYKNQQDMFNADNDGPYDYIFKYLKVDKDSIRTNSYTDIANYYYLIRCFNVMVYYSADMLDAPKTSRRLDGGYIVSPDKCVNLRELILKYAGDRNEK